MFIRVAAACVCVCGPVTDHLSVDVSVLMFTVYVCN